VLVLGVMGCGTSQELLPGLALVEGVEQRGLITGVQLLREPVAPPKPARSALVGCAVPSQCAGAAGVVAACNPLTKATLDTPLEITDVETRGWQLLSRTAWAHGIAQALNRDHQLHGAAFETCHPLADVETLREFGAEADRLFWGNRRVSPLPLTWRMAVAAIHRLRQLGGVATEHALYDHDCSATGVSFAVKFCAAAQFDIGTTVRLQGLDKNQKSQNKALLNGQEATIVSFDKQNYVVELTSGVQVKSKPENLTNLADPNDDGMDERDYECELGGCVPGGRSPVDTVETLLADPLYRRALPLSSGTESFGIAFAMGRLDAAGRACGVVPQRQLTGERESDTTPPAPPPRFLCYPADGDGLAVRGSARGGQWRAAVHAACSGLVISLVLSQEADVVGFLALLKVEWVDITDVAEGAASEGREGLIGEPVPHWHSDPAKPSYELQDQVLVGALELLPAGRRYRIAVTLSLSAGAGA
jgi:hypothetical protein